MYKWNRVEKCYRCIYLFMCAMSLGFQRKTALLKDFGGAHGFNPSSANYAFKAKLRFT